MKSTFLHIEAVNDIELGFSHSFTFSALLGIISSLISGIFSTLEGVYIEKWDFLTIFLHLASSAGFSVSIQLITFKKAIKLDKLVGLLIGSEEAFGQNLP
jgi:hypothetical protein